MAAGSCRNIVVIDSKENTVRDRLIQQTEAAAAALSVYLDSLVEADGSNEFPIGIDDFDPVVLEQMPAANRIGSQGANLDDGLSKRGLVVRQLAAFRVHRHVVVIDVHIIARHAIDSAELALAFPSMCMCIFKRIRSSVAKR